MAQITSSRSEFMTSDHGLNDMEYKRKGGCFLSYNKVATIVIIFIVSVIVAGLIGAYVSPWNKKRTITALALIEEDEINGSKNWKKFSISSSIHPIIYTIELTPIIDDISTKFKGRVIIEFTYDGTEQLSKIVLNAKGIAVSSAKLFYSKDSMSKNYYDGRINSRRRRRRREDDVTSEASSFYSLDTSESTNRSSIIENDTSSTDDPLGVTSINIGNKITTSFLNDSSNENITNDVETSSPTSTIASNIVINEKEKIESSSEISSIFRIVSPSLDELPRKIEKISTEILISYTELDPVDEFYVIYLNDPLLKGSYYCVELNYEANVDGRNTFANYYDLEDRKRWLLATKLKPFGARTLFPGFHDLNSRTKFSLSIARPKTFNTLYNMPLKSSDSISDNWTMDHFEISPPLLPDSLAFVISDLKPVREITTDDSNTTLTLWTKSMKIDKSNYISEKLSTVTHLLSEYFSSENPLQKLDVAVIPGLVDDGSGSIGLIFLKESIFDVTRESSSILRERTVMNIVKLIGEQWLGGLVSAKSWTDAWFLDGTSIYLQYLLANKIDPAIDPFDSIGILQHSTLEMDSYQVSKSLSSRKNLASFESDNLENTFRKGACLIRMMHGAVLSESGFRNGYKKFIARWSNAETDLSNFLISMSNEANWLPDGISFEEIIMPWIDQSGFPVVSVTRNYESRTVVVRQEQFLFDNSTSKNHKSWYIPVTYVIDGIDEWSSPSKFWLKQREEMTLSDVGGEEEVDKKWILFNVNQSGYYRVNYDENNWKMLSTALNLTSNKFPVTTRTSLVDDALSLAWGGWLRYSTAFNLINYLRENESHHSPWTVAFENMVKLNNLLYNTQGYKIFQEFMTKFISPLFKKVTTSSSVESELKLMAIKWACLIDNPSCRTYMKNFFSVPEYMEEIYECAIARFGGKSEWDSLILKISHTKDREIKLKLITALPCFQIEWILQSILDEILKGEKFNAEEILALLKSFNENPMASRSAFKFIRRNWERIFEKYSKSYQISRAFLLASIKGITDDQDLKEFQIFKEEHREKLRFMGHTIAIAEAEATSRISWLNNNFLPVQRWIEDFIERTS